MGFICVEKSIAGGSVRNKMSANSLCNQAAKISVFLHDLVSPLWLNMAYSSFYRYDEDSLFVFLNQNFLGMVTMTITPLYHIMYSKYCTMSFHIAL